MTLASTAQDTPPAHHQTPSDRVESPQISRNRVVLIIAAQDGGEPPACLGYRPVHGAPQGYFQLSWLRMHSLRNRCTPELKPAMRSRYRANVCKAEEVKCLCLVPAALLIPAIRKATKRNQPRLLGMQLKPEFLHARFEVIQELLRFEAMFEAQDRIIRIADDGFYCPV
jgi:hypothetical protein